MIALLWGVHWVGMGGICVGGADVDVGDVGV